MRPLHFLFLSLFFWLAWSSARITGFQGIGLKAKLPLSLAEWGLHSGKPLMMGDRLWVWFRRGGFWLFFFFFLGSQSMGLALS